MAKPRVTLVVLAVLGLSLFLVLPAEDLTDTAYDESELLPYESTLEAGNLIVQAAASMTQRAPLPSAIRSEFHPALTPGSPTQQARIAPSETRAALALLCTLLC